jgi:hypothetical protein
MAGVARDNYRHHNERNEERKYNPIPHNFRDLTGNPLERFMIKWYDNWRSGEEFDGAGKGKDNYQPVSLQVMYDSFRTQWKEQGGSGEAPLIGPEFGRLLKYHDEEYLWAKPPTHTNFDLWDPRDRMHKHSQPEKGPHPVIRLNRDRVYKHIQPDEAPNPVIRILRDKAGSNERVGEDVVNAVLKLIT